MALMKFAGNQYIPYFIGAACTPHVTSRKVIVSDMSVVQYLALYCIAFTLQKLTWEKSDNLGPKLGARAFMGLFAGTRM